MTDDALDPETSLAGADGPVEEPMPDIPFFPATKPAPESAPAAAEPTGPDEPETVWVEALVSRPMRWLPDGTLACAGPGARFRQPIDLAQKQLSMKWVKILDEAPA